MRYGLLNYIHCMLEGLKQSLRETFTGTSWYNSWWFWSLLIGFIVVDEVWKYRKRRKKREVVENNSLTSSVITSDMFCQHCGRELRSGTKFCPGCGTKITKVEISS